MRVAGCPQSEFHSVDLCLASSVISGLDAEERRELERVEQQRQAAREAAQRRAATEDTASAESRQISAQQTVAKIERRERERARARIAYRKAFNAADADEQEAMKKQWQAAKAEHLKFETQALPLSVRVAWTAAEPASVGGHISVRLFGAAFQLWVLSKWASLAIFQARDVPAHPIAAALASAALTFAVIATPITAALAAALAKVFATNIPATVTAAVATAGGNLQTRIGILALWHTFQSRSQYADEQRKHQQAADEAHAAYLQDVVPDDSPDPNWKPLTQW